MAGRLFGSPVLVLRTVGRRSGARRESPVLYVPHGGGYAVVASNAGSDKVPAWWLNLQSEPQAHVLAGGNWQRVTARRASKEEAAGLWPRIASRNAAFAKYRARAGRDIPVVILERTEASSSDDTQRVEVSAGTIEYRDTGGDGETVVLLHGVTMNGTLWRNVTPELEGRYRLIVPTLPLGSHRLPMHPDADLTLRGQVRIVADFLEALGLEAATLVSNDWGGGLLLMSEGRDQRIARMVLAACETFDNYPPGLPGKVLAWVGRAPGGLWAVAHLLRLRPLRRLPTTYGWMSKRPVPDEIVDGWLSPLRAQRAIRRDLEKYVRGVRGARGELMAATERLIEFDHPVLVAWGPEDRVMPVAHGRRLARMLPQGRFVEIADSFTLIPEDQPIVLAEQIDRFIRETPLPAAEMESVDER